MQAVDARAIIDMVLGKQASTGEQRFEAALDLFSEHNFYVDRKGALCGVFIASPLLSPVGQLVGLKLTLMGRKVVEAQGRVAWQRPRRTYGGKVPPGMGIGLEKLDEEARLAIDLFLEQREPMIWTA